MDLEKLKKELLQGGNLLGLFFLIIGFISLFRGHPYYTIAGISAMSFGLGIIVGHEMYKD